MARDLGDAGGQTSPRIERSVSGSPVRPIGAFKAGMAGSAEPEIATFANTFRCFDVPGNPGFARLPGARNRDFREEIPPFWGAGKSNFWRLP